MLSYLNILFFIAFYKDLKVNVCLGKIPLVQEYPTQLKVSILGLSINA